MRLVLITIFIYSLILTLVTLYKDCSGYFIVDAIDIVTAGPCCWMLVLIVFLLRPLFKNKNSHKDKPFVPKSNKYIKNVVKKIVNNYSKKCERINCWDYIDFSRMSGGEFNVNDIEGWDVLMVKKPIYEGINKKFLNLMCSKDEDRTILELKTHFKRMTKEDLEKENVSQFFIAQYGDREFYELKDAHNKFN
jgi:hypothetical protein